MSNTLNGLDLLESGRVERFYHFWEQTFAHVVIAPPPALLWLRQSPDPRLPWHFALRISS